MAQMKPPQEETESASLVGQLCFLSRLLCARVRECRQINYTSAGPPAGNRQTCARKTCHPQTASTEHKHVSLWRPEGI